MRQILRNKLREQKGLTLIELLAVIVILGIIAAIAVPSILGIIDNSKLDAHVGNAQQMVNAARNAVAQNEVIPPASSTASAVDIDLQTLITKGYIEDFEDPTDDDGYFKTGSKVTITRDASGKIKYAVTLVSKKTSTNEADRTHISGIDSTLLDRDLVTK